MAKQKEGNETGVNENNTKPCFIITPGTINWEIDLHWNGCWISIKNAKSKDNTIAEKFNVYRLAYKEQLIDLLARVCTLSIKTIAIIELMA